MFPSICGFPPRHRSTIQMSTDKEKEAMLLSLIKCLDYMSGVSVSIRTSVFFVCVQMHRYNINLNLKLQMDI